VDFLVDTGADRSVLAPSEYQDYFRYQDASRYPLSFPSGFGGSMRTHVVPARLALRTDAGAYLFEPLMIEVPDPRGYVKGLPSVMGRDVLSRVRLELDRSSGTVALREPEVSAAVQQWLFEDEEEFARDFDGLTYRQALIAARDPATYPGLNG
jgi:hypothetical protein